MSALRPLFALLCLLPLLGSGGCGPDRSDLQSWLARKDGSRSLAHMVADAQRGLELRTLGAELLARAGATLELADALAKSEPEDRRSLASALAPTLEAMLGGSQEEQIRAKEAIYYVGGYAAPADAQRLATALLAWALADLPGRARLGDSPLQEVLPALGTQAALPLLTALRAGGPPRELTAALIALDGPEIQRATALALAERVRALRPAIPVPLASALVSVPRPELAGLLGELALDARLDADMRGAFLDQIPVCGGPDAAPALLRLLLPMDTRWVAAQHLLKLEGLEGLRRVLEALPADEPYAEDDEDLYHSVDFFCEQNVAQIGAERERIERVLLEGLAVAPWPGKLVALHCLGRWGSPAAAPELQRSANYTRRLPGWKPAGATLGQVARDALARTRG